MGTIICIIIAVILWIGLKSFIIDSVDAVSEVRKDMKENITMRMVVCGFLGGFFLLFSVVLFGQYASDPKEYGGYLSWALGLLIIAIALIVPAIIAKKKYDNL